MKSNYRTYNFDKSIERIDDILNESENVYEELNEIPSRDKLTFTNGFYVNCSALYVDIRDSSSLPDKHTRPKLAKLYRSYISEVVAIMNGNENCKEIVIEGDCVFGIFNTPYKSNINGVFSTAAQISSITDILNCKFKKKKIEEITIGIGMAYGRALMIKAGYSGSGINDVVWMGNVLNEAAKLCGYGNKEYYDKEMMVSKVFYNNLNDNNKSLLDYNNSRDCYHGNIVNTSMNDWYKENCSEG